MPTDEPVLVRKAETFVIVQGELGYAGHDASYTYWTSDARNAIYFMSVKTLLAECERAGLTVPRIAA